MGSNFPMVEEDGDVLVLDEIADKKHLILFNDDTITFDHVIACLIKYCKHTEIQAEQCAIIVHTKGKVSVKEGTFDYLADIKAVLDNNNLTTEIQ